MLQQTTESSERRVRAREIVLSQVKSARPFATPTTNDTFLRFVPSLVSRDDDGVICECEYSEEFLEKPSLGLAVMLLNQYCDNVKPFADSLMEISGLYGKPVDSLQKPVRKFLLMSMLGEKPNIETLLDDLEGKPATWFVTAHLVGIVPESRIFLSADVILRRLDEADLAYEVPLQARLITNPPYRPFPDSVLQATIVSDDIGAVQRRVEAICRVLSLYRETGASWSSLSIQSSSFSQIGMSQTLLVPIAQEPRARLKQGDEENLAKFVRDFIDKLPSGLMDDKLVGPLDVSLRRYLDSTRGNLPIPERLTSTVMGQEALLLENQGEARFRLAIRSANLLRLLKEDPASVYRDLLEAYDYRSAHVHGSALSDDKQARAGQLLGSLGGI